MFSILTEKIFTFFNLHVATKNILGTNLVPRVRFPFDQWSGEKLRVQGIVGGGGGGGGGTRALG